MTVFAGFGASQDQDHVGIGPGAVRGVGGGALDDAFGSGAEMLADDEPAVPASQGGCDLRRASARPGQHRDLRVGPAYVDRRARVAAVRADHGGVVPGQASPGEGQRDRRHRRQNRGRQAALAQRADDAEETRVAGGEHHGVTLVRGEGVECWAQLPERHRARTRRNVRTGPVAGSTRLAPGWAAADGGGRGQGGEVPPAAYHERGRRQGRLGPRAERRAVDADDGDHAVFTRPGRPGGLWGCRWGRLAEGRPVMPRSPTPAWLPPPRACR